MALVVELLITPDKVQIHLREKEELRIHFTMINQLLHCHLKKDEHGQMISFKKPVEPYLIPLDDEEQQAYNRLRVKTEAA